VTLVNGVQVSDDPEWYRTAVLYQVHVRCFADGNGDGIGDFEGLTSRLDYIQELGATAIWLLPFYPSPLRDGGYDISDYTGIHPDYGTMADFRTFVQEAHARGLRVITEVVINHPVTSMNGFNEPGMPRQTASGATFMSGVRPTVNTKTRGLSLPISSPPTGPGTQSQIPTFGTGFTVINPT